MTVCSVCSKVAIIVLQLRDDSYLINENIIIISVLIVVGIILVDNSCIKSLHKGVMR